MRVADVISLELGESDLADMRIASLVSGEFCDLENEVGVDRHGVTRRSSLSPFPHFTYVNMWTGDADDGDDALAYRGPPRARPAA